MRRSATWAVLLAIGVMAAAAGADRFERPMKVHRVAELGLEIWTEANPEWETRLERETGAPRPMFSAETPAQTYPPAGMSWAVPGLRLDAGEMEPAARSALRQAALNYGLGAPAIERIALKRATYGELSGYEAEFAAVADTVPVDVRVFFGHAPGRPAVAMQVFTLRGKLPHLDEQIRRSWSHVRYLR